MNPKLICTGTTGSLVEAALKKKMDKNPKTKIDLLKLKTGPLGGN